MKYHGGQNLWIILVVGILVSTFLSVFTFRYEEDKEYSEFVHYSDSVFDEIISAFNELESINRSIALLFNSSDVVSEKQFGLFSRSILIRYPFLEDIYYIPRVERSDVARIEQEKRNQGYTGFLFRTFQGKDYSPSPLEKDLFPVEYVQPFNVKTSVLVGRDILTFAPAQKTILHSINQGGMLMLSPTENTLFAFSALFYGKDAPEISNIDDVYAILGYKIDPQALVRNHIVPVDYLLKISVGNMDIRGKGYLKKTSIFSSLYEQTRSFGFNDQNIVIYLGQVRDTFAVEYTPALLVLLAGVLLTVLVWYVLRANIEHNYVLLSQNQLIETEVNEKTRQLQNQKSQLEKAYEDQLTATEELKSFSYSVSHDLRTPLRAIDGFCQILYEDYAEQLDETGNEHLDRVRKGAQRMGELIDNMLNLARVSHRDIKHEDVCLSEFANEIIQQLRTLHPDRSVEVHIARDIRVTGDSTLLYSVMNNLLSNAWKYTEKTDKARIIFSQHKEEDETVYTVEDNGAGFNMEYADKLFKPFQRLHGGDFSGHGIGLATVERIIKRHLGRIWAEGKKDQGAIFSFTIGTYKN